jgi:hypothetical protein
MQDDKPDTDSCDCVTIHCRHNTVNPEYMPPDPFTPIEVKVYDLRVPVATAVIAFAVGYFIGRFIEWVDNG